MDRRTTTVRSRQHSRGRRRHSWPALRSRPASGGRGSCGRSWSCRATLTQNSKSPHQLTHSGWHVDLGSRGEHQQRSDIHPVVGPVGREGSAGQRDKRREEVERGDQRPFDLPWCDSAPPVSHADHPVPALPLRSLPGSASAAAGFGLLPAALERAGRPDVVAVDRAKVSRPVVRGQEDQSVLRESCVTRNSKSANQLIQNTEAGVLICGIGERTGRVECSVDRPDCVVDLRHCEGHQPRHGSEVTNQHS